MTRVALGVVILGMSGMAVRAAGATLEIGVEVVLLPAMIGVLTGVLLRLADRRHGHDPRPGPLPDAPSTAIASMAARIRAASRTRHEALSGIAVHLRPLVHDVLAERGVDPGDDEAAARLVGEDLWRLVTDARDPRLDRDRPGIATDELARHLDRLEAG